LIFVELWRIGLLGRVDREKLRFFLGLSPGLLLLSRHMPLVRSVRVWRAVFSPAYARALASWLRYRVELYDGLQG
jgi:hypothetical protein